MIAKILIQAQANNSSKSKLTKTFSIVAIKPCYTGSLNSAIDNMPRQPTLLLFAYCLAVADCFIVIPQAHRRNYFQVPVNPYVAGNHQLVRPESSSRLHLSSTKGVSKNEDLLPGIAAIDGSNSDLYNKLEIMRNKPYFRLYSVDILASCEYLPQTLFECYSDTCEIYPVEEDEVSTAVVLAVMTDRVLYLS